MNSKLIKSGIIFLFILSIHSGFLHAQDGNLQGETIRMLIIGDVFSIALAEGKNTIEDTTGVTLEIEVVGYDEVRQLTLLNATNAQSEYDIVAVDVVWIGEYSNQNILLPLNEMIARSGLVEVDDFIQIAYEAGQAPDGAQLTLPIQPHPELLWYRTDLFEAAGLPIPQTTDDVLHAAEILHNPSENIWGICWNGQRGQAFGQTMAHFYAAFGQPLLDENGMPQLNTDAGVAAAEYALALIPYSPPDILTMAWDQRILRFSQGGCAMTYGWAARTYLVEEEPTSSVAGLVGYTGAPHAIGQAAITPMGVWSLGIPSNIGNRGDIAWEFLEWLTSRETLLTLAELGNGGMPRYSVLNNEALAARYPAFSTVAELSEADILDDWMRPAVSQWAALADILGTVYHDMLRGLLTPTEAAEQAQSEAIELFNHSPRR